MRPSNVRSEVPTDDTLLGSSGEVNPTDAGLWHPWLRINRVLRVGLHTRWSAEAWAKVRVEFKKALALRSQILSRANASG
jgi:hypothetical protein